MGARIDAPYRIVSLDSESQERSIFSVNEACLFVCPVVAVVSSIDQSIIGRVTRSLSCSLLHSREAETVTVAHGEFSFFSSAIRRRNGTLFDS